MSVSSVICSHSGIHYGDDLSVVQVVQVGVPNQDYRNCSSTVGYITAVISNRTVGCCSLQRVCPRGRASLDELTYSFGLASALVINKGLCVY